MKKVLLIGDSIRIGYQNYVKEMLKEEAEVVYPEENCMFSKYTLWGVNLWLNDLGRPDIIHFNTGLWDLHHEAPMIEPLTDINEYLTNLRRIVNELERTGAKIIFATTTPVARNSKGRSNAEIELYNKKARILMEALDVEVNDLHYLVKKDLDSNICEDTIHLTEKCYKNCAINVVDHIRKYI